MLRSLEMPNLWLTDLFSTLLLSSVPGVVCRTKGSCTGCVASAWMCCCSAGRFSRACMALPCWLLSLRKARSSQYYRSFLPRGGRPRPALVRRWVGCLMLGRCASCGVSLTCHSTLHERGGDRHPEGLFWQCHVAVPFF